MKTQNSRSPRMLLGKAGEDAVCGFLTREGHTILERNYRTGHLEIDIISLDGNGVHFVEVKTRVAPAPTRPGEKCDTTKQRRIAKAAGRYLSSNEGRQLSPGLEMNFDVASVIFENGDIRIEWLPNAYFPMFL
ncbi:MAG: YraN family protein [Candidatus Cryptobacteroides sp.]